MKFVQNVLFRPCGGRFHQIAFFQRFRAKNRSTGQKFTPIRKNSRLSRKIVQNVLFLQCWERFDQIAFSQRFRAKNRSTGLKFTPIGESSRLSMKIVQNVLFRQCGWRFGQIAFFNVLDQKIAPPASNSRKYVKTVGLPWNLYQTCFSGNAEDVLTKSHLSTF